MSLPLEYGAWLRPDMGDLWAAYREGAKDGRANPSVTDEQIERACDAYVKLVIHRQMPTVAKADANCVVRRAEESPKQ